MWIIIVIKDLLCIFILCHEYMNPRIQNTPACVICLMVENYSQCIVKPISRSWSTYSLACIIIELTPQCDLGLYHEPSHSWYTLEWVVCAYLFIPSCIFMIIFQDVTSSLYCCCYYAKTNHQNNHYPHVLAQLMPKRHVNVSHSVSLVITCQFLSPSVDGMERLCVCFRVSVRPKQLDGGYFVYATRHSTFWHWPSIMASTVSFGW